MDEPPQRSRGAAGRAFRRGVPRRYAAETEVVNVLIEAVGADLERQLDGGDVAGLLKRLVDGDRRRSAVALVVMNDAAGERDLAALAVDHVVGLGDVWIDRRGVSDELEDRAGLVDVADGVVLAAARAWCGETGWD